jgi:hypothetical protein
VTAIGSPTAHFAEVYESDAELAIVIGVTDHTARLRTVVDGRAVPFDADFELTHDQLNRDWTLIQTLPKLRCISEKAAHQAATLLAGKGVDNVFVSGYVLAASMSVGSVMRLADDALENGWAHDAACARMIGDLG